MVSDLFFIFLFFSSTGLNPCSNGIWSLTDKEVSMLGIWLGLNPCSNGIWSLTEGWQLVRISGLLVLILVLMEYGL